MSEFNQFTQWKTNPVTHTEHMGHMCLCTCYACYHLCSENFKKVVPLAVLKHQLHAMELKAQGTYTEPNWDGMLLHRGQNAPQKPEEFGSALDGYVQNVQQAYTYTQPYGATTILHEGKPFHCRCNCVCLACNSQCVEVTKKEAAAKRCREENLAVLQKQFEANLEKAAEETATLIQGVTDETAGRLALGSIWCQPPPPVDPNAIPPHSPSLEPKPRFLSPNINWPYARCKLVYRALKNEEGGPSIVNNHLKLLNWLANWFGLPLEEFKDKSLCTLAKERKWRFSHEARNRLLLTYPARLGIGRELRYAFHNTHAY